MSTGGGGDPNPTCFYCTLHSVQSDQDCKKRHEKSHFVGVGASLIRSWKYMQFLLCCFVGLDSG